MIPAATLPLPAPAPEHSNLPSSTDGTSSADANTPSFASHLDHFVTPARPQAAGPAAHCPAPALGQRQTIQTARNAHQPASPDANAPASDEAQDQAAPSPTDTNAPGSKDASQPAGKSVVTKASSEDRDLNDKDISKDLNKEDAKTDKDTQTVAVTSISIAPLPLTTFNLAITNGVAPMPISVQQTPVSVQPTNDTNPLPNAPDTAITVVPSVSFPISGMSLPAAPLNIPGVSMDSRSAVPTAVPGVVNALPQNAVTSASVSLSALPAQTQATTNIPADNVVRTLAAPVTAQPALTEAPIANSPITKALAANLNQVLPQTAAPAVLTASANPVQQTPAQQPAVPQTTVKQTDVQPVTAQQTQVTAQQTNAQQTAVPQTTVQQTPAQQPFTAQQANAQQTTAKPISVVQQTNVQQAPAQQTVAQQLTVQQTTVQQATVQQSSTVQQTNSQQTIVQQLPAQQTTAKQADVPKTMLSLPQTRILSQETSNGDTIQSPAGKAIGETEIGEEGTKEKAEQAAEISTTGISTTEQNIGGIERFFALGANKITDTKSSQATAIGTVNSAAAAVTSAGATLLTQTASNRQQIPVALASQVRQTATSDVPVVSQPLAALPSLASGQTPAFLTPLVAATLAADIASKTGVLSQPIDAIRNPNSTTALSTTDIATPSNNGTGGIQIAPSNTQGKTGDTSADSENQADSHHEETASSAANKSDNTAQANSANPLNSLHSSGETAVINAITTPSGSSQIARAQIVEQVTRHLESMRISNGEGEMRLRLAPAHLGNVQISVATHQNGVTARIAVESAQIQQAMEGAKEHLRTTLEARGLHVNSVEVTVTPNLIGSGGAAFAGERGWQPAGEQATSQSGYSRPNSASQASDDLPESVPTAFSGTHVSLSRLDYRA